VISGFELAVGPMGGVRFVVESAVGERTAEALVKEQEEKGDVNAFRSQAVGIAAAIALEQSVPFEFAEIVAELGSGRTISGIAETW
jgi:hypothetical protein